MAEDGATRYAGTIMEKRVKVVLYGNTLVLAGLQASLAAYAGLEVLCVAEPLADAQEFSTLRPDVIIVDAAAIPAPPLRLLNDLPPDLLLVSVDVATDRVQVWSGQQLSAASTHDLVALIGQRREAVDYCFLLGSSQVNAVIHAPPHWSEGEVPGHADETKPNRDEAEAASGMKTGTGAPRPSCGRSTR